MSRIGNRIIMIPEGVTVENKDNTITVTGPKGTLSKPLLNGVNFEAKDGQIKLTIEDESKNAMHGTMNALINNMIIGVTKGYSKVLEIVGVGYRFNVQGSKLVINAGYSHPVEVQIPEGIKGEVKDNAVYLLCSDGFRHQISEEEIMDKLGPDATSSSEELQYGCVYLTELVKNRKETDNISVVVVKTF